MSKLLGMLLALSASNLMMSDGEMRDVVEQALDEPTTVAIEHAPLEQALATIAEKTGLGVSIGPAALDLLPYGARTTVSIQLNGQRLRTGIDTLCNELGMRYVTLPTGIELAPSAALERIGRRATFDELDIIKRLMEMKLSPGAGMTELEGMLQFRPGCSWDELVVGIEAAGSGSAYDLLTHACDAMGCTWFPWGDGVMVVPLEEETARRLQRPVSLRFSNRDIADVLRGLSHEAGVSVKLDPSAAKNLSPRVKQNFSLLAEGITVEEALEQIGIATGLAYRVDVDAIVLFDPDKAVAESEASQRPVVRDPIVGKVVIDGEGDFQFEFFIRASDLTEAENELRLNVIEDAKEAMRKELARRGG